MADITEEIRKKLREPLPSEAVSPHPTKTYLSSIKAIYVVERLNDVFGVGRWTTTSEWIVTEGKMVVVKSVLKIPEYDVRIEQYGGNDNADMGDAFKGATTDALTKMASYLEIGIDVFKGKGDKGKAPPPPSSHESEGKDEGVTTAREHWCAEHQTEFFKKGRMKGFAHPLEGGKWCDEGEYDAPGKKEWAGNKNVVEEIRALLGDDYSKEAGKKFPLWNKGGNPTNQELGVWLDELKEAMGIA